jgi:hypothetical protein
VKHDMKASPKIIAILEQVLKEMPYNKFAKRDLKFEKDLLKKELKESKRRGNEAVGS